MTTATRSDQITGVHHGTVTSVAATTAGVEVPAVAPGYTYTATLAAHVSGVTVGSRVVVAITADGCVVIARVPAT
ncbi:hypothetical protein [uncultured Arsenicicoccus sp.]|uniref:hypothetical protein n=1 Tax=uncultured Arsenicicoccus sp. TaxID=491339 RepID=UPI002594EA39|nr:hypothetical protein [uncultured Arsenicicoccus sp.]